jgi:aspartyl-tRNA(Asn)/glutamyl-tRNA(Gln) amidotransferase subunit A
MSSAAALAKNLAQNLAKVQVKFNPFTSIRPESLIASQLTAIDSDSPAITIALKDNIASLDEPTTCSSNALKNYTSPYEATVVSLLKEGQDVVVVGKTNLDEFGMGAGTTNSIFGPTYNPLYPEEKRICGGSSGGSAAAVAAGTVDIALGTDTGGSVRQPAALTGIYGFKPTYGRLSRWGVVAYAQSLDTVGILGKDLSLIEKAYHRMDKYDEKDPTSLKDSLRSLIRQSQEQQTTSKLRIGVPIELLIDNLSIHVSRSLEDALQTLSTDYEIVPVSIPSIKLAVPIYFTLTPSEAASNLARYDGIRYGFRSDTDKNNYSKTRTIGFGNVVQERIILGNFNLNSDSYKNHFLKAKRLRSQLRSEFNNVFKFPNHVYKSDGNPDGVDVLIGPTTMRTAQTIDEYQNQKATECFIDDALVIPASLAGLPAISVPWKIKENPVPVGLQVIGQYGDDKQVLEVAKVLENINK